MVKRVEQNFDTEIDKEEVMVETAQCELRWTNMEVAMLKAMIEVAMVRAQKEMLSKTKLEHLLISIESNKHKRIILA